MALVCLAADKGSPGVTTTAVALTAVWPRDVLLAETDPAGGDLAYYLTSDGQHPLDPDTGLLTLAASISSPTPDDVAGHTQRAHGGLTVLLGVPGPTQARAIGPLLGPLGHAFAGLPGTDVLADCGRSSGTDENLLVALMSHASVIVLMARDDAASIAHLRDRAAALAASWAPGDAPRLAVVIRTAPPRRDYVRKEAGKLFDAWHIPVGLITTIATDPVGAERMTAVGGRRRLAEPLLIRSARRLADELGTLLLPATEGAR